MKARMTTPQYIDSTYDSNIMISECSAENQKPFFIILELFVSVEPNQEINTPIKIATMNMSYRVFDGSKFVGRKCFESEHNEIELPKGFCSYESFEAAKKAYLK